MLLNLTERALLLGLLGLLEGLLALFIGPISLIGPIRLIDYWAYKANS